MRTLYRYVSHRLEKHKLTKDCMPQKEPYSRFGQLYRCRDAPTLYGRHDCYGYLLRKEAVAEEIELSEIEIQKLKAHVVKLKGDTR